MRREAWEERRRSGRSPQDQQIDALWIELFGNPRNPGDRGAVGDLAYRLDRLERAARWIAASVVTTMLLLIGDLIVRALK